MTCIVGIVQDGIVYMGADSQISHGWNMHTLAPSIRKVFCRDDLVIGACGDLRVLNVLKYRFTVPAHHPPEQDDLTFIATSVVDALRQCFKDAGVTEVNNNVESNGNSTILLGYRGRLFTVSFDWAVLEVDRSYVAIGSGESFAYGSLHATAYSSARLGANARIDKALQAAEMFDVGCSGPFVYEELPATEKVGEGKRNG